MDRKTLIFTIHRLYDVLRINERGEVFEFLERKSDDRTLLQLYEFMLKNYIKKN